MIELCSGNGSGECPAAISWASVFPRETGIALTAAGP